MKDIKDIFFDLDHTLWDFDRNSALAFKTVFKLNDISIDFTKFLEIYTPTVSYTHLTLPTILLV